MSGHTFHDQHVVNRQDHGVWIHTARPGPDRYHRRSEPNRSCGLLADLGQVQDVDKENGVHR